MKILFACLRHDYGDPSRGDSFEHTNFLDPLRALGHQVEYFDYASIGRAKGRRRMNNDLATAVRNRKPDLLFTTLFGDWIERRTIQDITEAGDTKTLNWFFDDQWRFETFSTRWADAFSAVATTAPDGPAKYKAIGYSGAIKTQYACNPLRYHPGPSRLRHDATFVGQPHGGRAAMLSHLARSGVRTEAWGYGWEQGRVDHGQMVDIFRSSRLNINFSFTSLPREPRLARLRRALRHTPAVASIWERYKRTNPVRLDDIPPPAVPPALMGVPQIKGRTFEVPACGGLLLTESTPDLPDYYVPGKEVATFADADDLVAQAKHLLAHEEERIEIARAGCERTHTQHTYMHRFQDIFTAIGLDAGSFDPGELPSLPVIA